jgi:hypothetical protein
MPRIPDLTLFARKTVAIAKKRILTAKKNHRPIGSLLS